MRLAHIAFKEESLNLMCSLAYRNEIAISRAIFVMLHISFSNRTNDSALKICRLSHQVAAAEFPHLPLPDVAKTMERYLDAVAAVVPAEDHARARLQERAMMKTLDCAILFWGVIS